MFHLDEEREEEEEPTLTPDDDSAQEAQSGQSHDETIDLTASPTIEMIDLSTPPTIDLCTPGEPIEDMLVDASVIHLSPN